MNNILFGLIGVLMLGITGIGYAEVKTQLHATEVASVAQEEESGSDESNATVGAAIDASASSKVAVKQTEKGDIPDTVPEVLSNVATRVEMAIMDRWDDEEREDEEEDEDEEEYRSAKTSVSTNTKTNTATNTNTNTSTASGASTGAASFTMAQIATHNSAASCYSAINGSVYDLTSFISQHPGGQSAIKSLCGVDGTAAYNGQHGGAGRPASELASLKIGVVK